MNSFARFLKIVTSILFILIFLALFFLGLGLYFFPKEVKNNPFYVSITRDLRDSRHLEETLKDINQDKEASRKISTNTRSNILTRPAPNAKLDKTEVQEVYYFELKTESLDSWLIRLDREDENLEGFAVSLQNYEYFFLSGFVYEDKSIFLEKILEDKKHFKFKFSGSLDNQKLTGYRLDLDNNLEKVLIKKSNFRSELRTFIPTSLNDIKINKEQESINTSNFKINLSYPSFDITDNQDNKIWQQIESDISFISGIENLQKNLNSLNLANKRRCEILKSEICEFFYDYTLSYEITFNQNGLLSILFKEQVVSDQYIFPQVRYYSLNYDIDNSSKLNPSDFFDNNNWRFDLANLVGDDNFDFSKEGYVINDISLNSQGFKIIFSDNKLNQREMLIQLNWSEIDFLSPVYF